jgi:hypothetical protein
MPEPVKVVFGLLSTYERNGWHHPSITQFFADLPFKTGYGFRVIPVNNFVPAASGRNVFCKMMKDTDADWICMIDNDMAIPEDLLETLKDVPADAGIVVPAFYLWDQTTAKLVLCWGLDNEPTKLTAVARFGPGFHELSKCGTGVIFIRPSVLRTLPYPYFRYLYNEDQGMAGTEDIQFCLRARELGVKIYGNASITVGHYHSVELSSLWKWAEASFGKIGIDTENAKGVVCVHQDAESPSVPQVAKASPASAT